MSVEKSCGCKGIRTCLLCEKQSNISAKSLKTEENQYVYNYCSNCNLCWPNDETTASLCDFPLYLGNIKLVPEFCSKEEESAIISFIDRIPWMLSQSGRRKQDFGPKVNFKKKKVKIGEFKGFPKFTENMIKKLHNFPDLSDFNPVELCNLEYTPERGSSIDPHVDDFWLWGERLVTVNLYSTTILTLVPCSEVVCECFPAANCKTFQSTGKHSIKRNSCKHLFQNGNPINSLECFLKNDTTACSSSNNELLKDELQNSELSNKTTQDKQIQFFPTANKLNTEEIQFSEICCNNVLKMNCHDCIATDDSKIPTKTKTSSSTNVKVTDNKVDSICNLFRTCSNGSKVCVRIVLPPRSLFVLAGCARYNWFHEIKRQDVVSRRLAMTFRELSAEFLDEGKESQCGKDLLLTAKNFYDL